MGFFINFLNFFKKKIKQLNFYIYKDNLEHKFTKKIIIK